MGTFTKLAEGIKVSSLKEITHPIFIKRWTPYGKKGVKIVGGASLKKADVTPDHVLLHLKKLFSARF